MTKPSVPRRRRFIPLRGVLPIVQPFAGPHLGGFDILSEHEGIGGLLLWECFHDAELWAGSADQTGLFATPGRQRHDAINTLDEDYQPIRPHLHLLDKLRGSDAPTASEIAASCYAIARWSEGLSRLGTAVEYIQVASLADPDQALYAVHAGRLLRMRAEWARAWSWFDHAIFLARRDGDAEALSYANASLGFLYLERGNFPKAKPLFKRALRVARRHHLPERMGVACHNLFVLEASSGNWHEAERYAVVALKSYPTGSAYLSRLARDFAFRSIQRGDFEGALRLAQEVLEHFTGLAERGLVWSDIARAAAGTGNLEVFERAWAESFVNIQSERLEPYTIAILLNLAHGATYRGDAPRAELAATRAFELARERGESQSVLEAEALLDSLRTFRLPRPPARDRGAREGIADLFVSTLARERAAV